MITNPEGKSQKAAWGGYELLDRQSLLVDEDGSTDNLDVELTEALVAEIGAESPQGLRAFLDELLINEGFVSLEDFDGLQLSEVIQGILD